MAFTGLHVAAGFSGGQGRNGRSAQLITNVIWSQTMTSAGITAEGNVAPPSSQSAGDPVFRVTVSAASYVAIGPNPDAVNGPRSLLQSNETNDFLVNPGDRLAYVPA